tara:strand:+ start:2490 stop:2753 length:264 start_codon:yes stop_codon:yes gene_type:complete
MSFIVSFSFIPHETIERWRLIKLFQYPMLPAAETALNKEPISNCFRVSVVPLLIHLLNETEKVLKSCLNACIPIVIVGQDSTMQGAA